MALLGAQLVITLIMVSIIQKFSPHFSLAKWILCSTGLIRYLHPTDDELRTLAGVPKERPKNRKGGKNGAADYSDTFHIPRNLEVSLETAPVNDFEVTHLRFFAEYQWLVDFTLYATIVYAASELYHSFVPIKDEVNLSMLWCLLIAYFSFKLLASLTVQYFRSEESIGERSTCIVTGFLYLLVAMMVLIVPDNVLETGLDRAYASFNESASVFLSQQGIRTTGPASKLIIKFFIAVSCGVLGAFFTFPGLRMARMHWDSLRYCTDRPLLKILLNFSFVMPLFLVVLWIRPISREYFTERVFSGMSAPLLSPGIFESVRIALVIFAVLLRLALMPVYLQAYLNLAYDRIQELKKEVGRITNKDYCNRITSIFYYLCVVTLQYVAPLFILLACVFMYKTLGGYSWTGFPLPVGAAADECPLSPADAAEDSIEQVLDTVADAIDESGIMQTARHFQSSLQNLKGIFSQQVYRGMLGFATWWCGFLWFSSTSLGIVYQTYFSKT